MIQDNQKQLNRLRIVLDLIVIAFSYFLTYLLFFYVFPKTSAIGGSFSLYVTSKDYTFACLYIVPLHLIIYSLLHLYRPMRTTGRRIEAFRILIGNLLSVALVVLFFWLFIKTYGIHFSRMFLFEFGFINTFLIILERNILRNIIVVLRSRGFNQKNVLIIGYSDVGERFMQSILDNKRWGYHVYGVLDDETPVGTKFLDFEVTGTISELPEILSKNEVDEVFITLPLGAYNKLARIVSVTDKSGVVTKFIPDYSNLMSNRPYTEDLAGLPVVYIRKVPLDDMWNAFMKRTGDILISFLCLILFSPIFLLTALLVKLTSKGPIFYKQERIGRHNHSFYMYKFRSMVVQDEAKEKTEWTKKGDARVTKFGSFIRKTSIDELPQLWNVLIGQMSLIGPRPERPQFVEKFKEEIPHYMIKHLVRPGMTGWAQVNGLRGDTSIEKRIEKDIYYIENWSAGLDIKILVLTLFKGFINKNAY